MSLKDAPGAARLRKRLPLQVAIRNAILDDFILSGRVSPGDKLPSEGELCEAFAASRVTVRAALQSLQEQGYIRTVRGSGSIVLPRSQAIHSSLTRLVSFDTFALQSGEKFKTVDITVEYCPAEDLNRDRFPAAEREGLIRISRAKMRGGKRVSWIVDYVPSSVASLDELTKLFARYQSVLDILLARDQAEYSDCTVTPAVVDTELATHLDQPVGTAVLQMSELTHDLHGNLVDISEAWLTSDGFTFYLRRSKDAR